MIESFLQSLGLTDNETRVYLYLLTHGESIASIVAKRLGIKRASVYQVLESLEAKGLIVEFSKNNVSHFDSVDPEDLVGLCEQRVFEMKRLQQKAEVLKHELVKLREKGKMPTLEIRGKIKYYQGLEAVTQLIDETLKEKSKEQLCFGLNTYHTELAGDDWGDYTKKRVAQGMFVRSIQPDIEEALEYASRDKSELRETRLVPNEKFPGKCEINIIGSTIAMFTTSGREPMGMKMHNKDLSEALRSLFNLAWERSQEYDRKRKK
ncbi:MAG: helix-turn-helix domain-containing protein [Candidatus Peribacteraceae bacterium]|nr:helix-turn-helix domain-containing protein [Candidatus Peribacteraceae bacterium]